MFFGRDCMEWRPPPSGWPQCDHLCSWGALPFHKHFHQQIVFMKSCSLIYLIKADLNERLNFTASHNPVALLLSPDINHHRHHHPYHYSHCQRDYSPICFPLFKSPEGFINGQNSTFLGFHFVPRDLDLVSQGTSTCSAGDLDSRRH